MKTWEICIRFLACVFFLAVFVFNMFILADNEMAHKHIQAAALGIISFIAGIKISSDFEKKWEEENER